MSERVAVGIDISKEEIVVAVAPSGEQWPCATTPEALERTMARIARSQPAVVVMDINMPKLNGIDATSRIKQAWPHITVIGLSVDWSPPIYCAMVKAGAVTLIHKEAAVDQLYPLIQNVLPAT